MIVFCKGKKINLEDQDFITAGGEGSIYKKNNLIYKVYLTKIGTNQEKKLSFLSCLKKDNIIAPVDILYSYSDEPIGYTMPFVDEASSLALFFTKSFKERNVIDSSKIEGIFNNMSETIKYIHEKDILIVDGNELNYLVSNKDWKTTFFLDVDSYQTKEFPSTAIMPSIQDFTSKVFTEETDWYSFAVLMFQLYFGIHPYRGFHPKYNISIDDRNGREVKFENLEARCVNKVSVFNKEVRYPKFIKFEDAPSNIMDWFSKIFDKGERLPPPNIFTSIVAKVKDTICYNEGMINTLLQSFDEDISNVLFIKGQLLVILQTKYFYGNRYFYKRYKREFPLVNEDSTVSSVTRDNSFIIIFNKGKEEKIEISSIKKMIYIQNRIFVITDESLVEVEVSKITEKLFVKSTWSIMANAAKFFRNCLYVNSYGNSVFYIPETKDSKNVLYIANTKCLNGHMILDAFYENYTLVVISSFKATYYKTVIKFDDNFITNVFIQEVCNLQEINSTVISNGMSLVFDEDNLELSAKGKTERKIVYAITDFTLSHKGNEVLGYKGKELHSLSLSK